MANAPILNEPGATWLEASSVDEEPARAFDNAIRRTGCVPLSRLILETRERSDRDNGGAYSPWLSDLRSGSTKFTFSESNSAR